MSTYIDIDLAIEQENKDKVIELFTGAGIEFTLEESSSFFTGDYLAIFTLPNREFAVIDDEETILMDHKIQFSAYNYGFYDEVDEQVRNFRIKDNTPIYKTLDLAESKISYTDLEGLIDQSENLENLKTLVKEYRDQVRVLKW